MNPPRFDDFFARATSTPAEVRQPYDYQRRLACGERDARPDAAWLASGTKCQSRLIGIPTGLGKTAAVVMAWLWNRVAHPDSAHRDAWPRRLVYCLPMRTLVEQTRDETQSWIAKLVNAGLIAEGRKPRVVVLMGGEILGGEEKDWDIYPEADTILIGTQDMLLSRALNRGYEMARARWPMHFGLLNNDALWVLDETQLMGVGLSTSAQLQAFRTTGTNTRTWWMSATLQSTWLETPEPRSCLPDSPRPSRPPLPPESQSRLRTDQPQTRRVLLRLSPPRRQRG